MSRDEYDIALNEYEERLIRVKKDIPVLQRKLRELRVKKKPGKGK